MTKEQLKQAIEQITHAIILINTCEGYDYLKAHHTTQLMIDERQRMEKQLNETYFISVDDELVTTVVGKLKATKELRRMQSTNSAIVATMEKW